MQVGRRFVLTLPMTLLAGALALPAAGQSADPGWNDRAALELVERGIERRSVTATDTPLRSYAADGRGYVYFLLDAPELDRQTLVRTDQVAVDVFWRAPDQLRQRIVGMRERRELPVTRLYYYLDRLTVVQDNFGQGIVIADGDNVNDVPHPIAEGAEYIYDYRLHDEVTLRLPGSDQPVTIQELQVRPKDPSRPAIIGSVFLAQGDGALVRMNFTFTASAYIDPRLDFINVTLENGLWEGGHWLPYEQRLEIRREMPELDLPFGTIIRTRMRVSDYRFDVETPDWLFAQSSPITMAPPAQREAFAFEQEIDAEWRLEGIGEPADVEEVRAEARRLVREQVLSGVRPSRLGARSLSEVVRYNRAEGAVAAIGWGVRPGEGVAALAHAGWAFGAGHPTLSLRVSPGRDIDFHGYLNRPGDVGIRSGAAGLTNSLGALLFAEDWLDPYYRSGLRAAQATSLGGGWELTTGAQIERQRSATLTSGSALFGGRDDFRPVQAIDEGIAYGLELALTRRPERVSGRWRAGLRLKGGVLDPTDPSETRAHALTEASVGVLHTAPAASAALEVDLSAGAVLGNAPRQALFLMGGRGTVPGYAYRSFGGRNYALLGATASADLARPWLRGRIGGALGWTGGAHEGLAEFGVGESGALPSISAGVGLFYDIIRVDVARGLGTDGRTELIIEISPAFRDFL